METLNWVKYINNYAYEELRNIDNAPTKGMIAAEKLDNDNGNKDNTPYVPETKTDIQDIKISKILLKKTNVLMLSHIRQQEQERAQTSFYSRCQREIRNEIKQCRKKVGEYKREEDKKR